MSTKPGKIELPGGVSFHGRIPTEQRTSLTGEIVFNTGMTGYVETLTDPSYSGQILVFTFPLIGNYGVPGPEVWESSKIHLRGVVLSELSATYAHAGSQLSLRKWLEEQGVPFIVGVDTRALTKYLRTRGTMPAIITSADSTDRPDEDQPTPSKISIAAATVINPGRPKTVVAVDCGMKQNILRSLENQGLTIKHVPHNYDYTAEEFDGVLISNGPGDPTDYSETIEILRHALELDKPIFGICLGAQLMGLAAGGTTYKLRFGHRGHNQPAISTSGKAYITSQNHGYALDEQSLPTDWKVTFRNLNDNSVEGLAHSTKPFFAVQFHPEATPGPTDTSWLFNEFFKQL